jgi:hypothetical protein
MGSLKMYNEIWGLVNITVKPINVDRVIYIEDVTILRKRSALKLANVPYRL